VIHCISFAELPRIVTSESGDIKQSETTAKHFLSVLADVVKSAENSPDYEQISESACRVLQEARALVTSSDPQGQVLLDVLTLDLPGVIVKFVEISENCREVCESIITHMCESCSPREMMFALSEALVSKDGSIAASLNTSEAPSLVLQLSELLPYCGLSYVGLITGRDVEVLNNFWNDDFAGGKIVESKSLVNKGAILAVFWGYACREVATVACENIDTLLKELRSCKSERIRALSNMKHMPSLEYPLQIRNLCIEFLLAMVTADSSPSKDHGEKIDWSSITPSLFALFQAMQSIVIHMPDPEKRKKAFSALAKTLSELPPHQRFDMLKGLIINSNNPSVASLLLAIVKEEINSALNDASKAQRPNSNNKDSHLRTPFITGDVLELVELILKPAKGGPPDLPAQSDAVIVALNLYRFLLMKEKIDKTNYTGVLSNSCLKKVHSEWLLPLRVLVSGILAENVNDNSEFGTLTASLLTPAVPVLNHCLELVEEGLKNSV